MCGIVAIARGRAGGVDPERMDRALAQLDHRGPDGSGAWISANRKVALGHRRLSLISPQDGSQPISSEDGQLHATINGELYQFESIRKTLEAKGHRFQTQSDSEIVIHLYKEHGMDFLQHLRGEFAIVLWDERRQKLIAARDRFGIKPLLFTSDQDELCIASEAKALFAAGVPARWDHDAVQHSLSHQYLPPSKTLFAGVSQLPPAHVLEWHPASPGQINLKCYWTPNFENHCNETDDGSLAKKNDRILNALREAVSIRLRADAPVAFALSGGLDSTAVVAAAAEASNLRPSCFCVSFDDADYDELAATESHSAVLGAELNPVPVRRTDLLEHLGEAVRHSEGLAINGQLVGKFLLSRAVQRSGAKAILSGEGADEAFLGYAHLQADLCRLSGLPAPKTEGWSPQAGVMLPVADGGTTADDLSLPGWLTALPTYFQAKVGFASHYLPLMKPDVRAAHANSHWLQRTLKEIAGDNNEKLPTGMDPVETHSWLWTRTALSNYILRTLGDGTEMAHSIEGRPPFLDHHLFQVAASLPTQEKINPQQTKIALRKALAPLLPKSIRNTPKAPFLAPPLLRGGQPQVIAGLRDLMRSQAMRDQPIFDSTLVVDWLENLLRAPESEQCLADPALTTILSFAAMQEAFQPATF